MLRFVVHTRAAVMLGQVDTGAEAVVFTKPLAQVQVAADIGAGGIIEADVAGWRVCGTLGNQVDRTANTAALGGDAVQKGVRPSNTSTRSSASVVMICRGSTPYRPL